LPKSFVLAPDEMSTNSFLPSRRWIFSCENEFSMSTFQLSRPFCCHCQLTPGPQKVNLNQCAIARAAISTRALLKQMPIYNIQYPTSNIQHPAWKAHGWAPKSVKYASSSSSVAYFRCSLFALAISLLIIFVCVVCCLPCFCTLCVW